MNINQNLTSVSKLSEVITSFRGPLIQYTIVKSINREKGTLRRWIVFSQGKRSTLIKYLFGKLLWDELNSFEQTIFWHLREITVDRTIWMSLKALSLGVSKHDLRKRLESGMFLGFKFITRQQYLTVKGRVNFFFLEEEISPRRTPKYSGYTKHYKDKGSLRPEREFLSEVLEPTSDVSDDILLSYLTVGEITLFGGSVLHPDDGSKKNRNGKLK
jgi:hypothetical protein